MTSSAYRYKFRDEANLLEAESTLHVAILAAEGLFGEARVRRAAADHPLARAARGYLEAAAAEAPRPVDRLGALALLVLAARERGDVEAARAYYARARRLGPQPVAAAVPAGASGPAG